MSDDLTRIETGGTHELPNEDVDPWQPGTWVWVKLTDKEIDSEDREPDHKTPCIVGREWFGCIMHRGSNYVKVHSVHGKDVSHYSDRVHLDEIHERCRVEPDPQGVIDSRGDHYRKQVRATLAEIREITGRLGVDPERLRLGQATSEPEAGALSRVVGDVNEYKAALIKAETEQLPALFKQAKWQNACMTAWMAAEALPMESSMSGMQNSLTSVQDRIHSVQLYAGLCEECVQVRKGAPASADAKLHVMQRRHYMDEECISAYTPGGMDIRDLKKFDGWVRKKENFERLFPFPRTIVAFRVRRYTKLRIAHTIFQFFQYDELQRLDKKTFLYIRNGDQLWRLETETNFDDPLFPDSSDFDFRDKYWVKVADWSRDTFDPQKMSLIPDREYQDIMASWRQRVAEYKEKEKPFRAWRKKNPKVGWHDFPEEFSDMYHASEPQKPKYMPFDHTSVYYDDASDVVAKWMKDYNRIALVIQGLFDRSVCLHPHPPVRTWEPQGFADAITLVFDKDRTLHFGEPPDFEAFRLECNASIHEGAVTIGQEEVWLEREREREEKRRENSYRRHDRDTTHWTPNYSGPGYLAEVVKWSRKQQTAKFVWYRGDARNTWRRETDKHIRDTITAPVTKLFNVSGYQPGDFKQFYADPRTRADYIDWAELLLTAEEYKAGNIPVGLDQKDFVENDDDDF